MMLFAVCLDDLCTAREAFWRSKTVPRNWLDVLYYTTSGGRGSMQKMSSSRNNKVVVVVVERDLPALESERDAAAVACSSKGRLEVR